MASKFTIDCTTPVAVGQKELYLSLNSNFIFSNAVLQSCHCALDQLRTLGDTCHCALDQVSVPNVEATFSTWNNDRSNV